MDSGKISARYAKAIYDFAVEKDEETKLYEEMKTLSEYFVSFKTLKKVLEDPTVSTGEKKKILTTAAGIKVSESYRSLLNVIAENKRESYANSIALMYIDYYRIQKGMLICRLTTAETATESTKKSLEQLVLKGSSHKRVDFITRTDPDIIGGFILKLDDNQLDTSVKTQLIKLKNQLMS